MEALGWRHRQVWRPLLAQCRVFFGEDGVRLRDPQLRDKLDDVPVVKDVVWLLLSISAIVFLESPS